MDRNVDVPGAEFVSDRNEPIQVLIEGETAIPTGLYELPDGSVFRLPAGRYKIQIHSRVHVHKIYKHVDG